MKVKLKKLYDFISNPLGFLLTSIIILLFVIHYGEEINKSEKIVLPPIPQYNHLVLNDIQAEYTDLPAEEEKTLDDEISFLLIKSDFNFRRSSRHNKYVQYEVQYIGSDKLYLKERNTKLENKIQELSLQLKDLWTKYGFDYITVRVMLLSEENEERVLFDAEDGVVTFTIHDTEKNKATKDDWIFLFEYVYQREPDEKELEVFIKTQEKMYSKIDI